VNWNPADYARNSNAQLGWARELITRLNLGGGEALLDVGCGDGKITAAVARAVPQGYVLGIDASPAFVAYARQHYPPADYPNLRFEQMDARRLACDRQFDIIFSNATLHWVDDQPAFLAGCAQLLVDGGRLVLSMGGAGNAAGVVAVMQALTLTPRWAGYFTDFAFPYYFRSPSEYAPWLAAAGFVATRLELVAKDMAQQGRDGLAGWVRTTWMPYTERVPESLREVLVCECVDAYLRGHPLDDLGRCHVAMVRLEVEAHLCV
jgi:trans-aconitate 2-methyltransferase